MSNIERFMRFVSPEPNSGCWLWVDSSYLRKGYGKFYINGRTLSAHRISYRMFCGEIPKNHVVMHKCDVTCCVNPDHLSTGTQRENIADMFSKNRQPRQIGSKNNAAKLTEEAVLEIRSSNLPQKELAKKFGVHRALISLVKKNKVWKHV